MLLDKRGPQEPRVIVGCGSWWYGAETAKMAAWGDEI